MDTNTYKCPVCGLEFTGDKAGQRMCDGLTRSWFVPGPQGQSVRIVMHPPARVVLANSRPSPLIGPYWKQGA